MSILGVMVELGAIPKDLEDAGVFVPSQLQWINQFGPWGGWVDPGEGL